MRINWGRSLNQISRSVMSEGAKEGWSERLHLTLHSPLRPTPRTEAYACNLQLFRWLPLLLLAPSHHGDSASDSDSARHSHHRCRLQAVDGRWAIASTHKRRRGHLVCWAPYCSRRPAHRCLQPLQRNLSPRRSPLLSDFEHHHSHLPPAGLGLRSLVHPPSHPPTGHSSHIDQRSTLR